MKVDGGQLTILVSCDVIRIELHDSMAGVTFSRIELTPEQFCAVISRQARVTCEKMAVFGLDKIGTIQQVGKHVFEIPFQSHEKRGNEDKLFEAAKATCPEGWVPDDYFASQDSFFTRDGKSFCRVTIRKWVKQETV